MFIKKNWKKRKKYAKYNVTKINRRKKNFSWIKDFLVRIHVFVKCWIKHDQNKENMKELKEKTVCCSSIWRKKIKNWHRNHVWVRNEFKDIRSNFINNESTSFKIKLFNQLQICVNIRNVKLMNVEKKSMLHYKIFVKIFRLKDNKFFDQIHEMFEIEHWLKSQVKNSRNFNYCHFYEFSNITRSAHLISITIERKAKNIDFKI